MEPTHSTRMLLLNYPWLRHYLAAGDALFDIV